MKPSSLISAFSAAVPVLFLAAGTAHPHGDHLVQSPSIIDPLITHHAVLEDELKLNLFGSRYAAGNLTGGAASLELAYAFSDLVGIEAFVPFGITDTAGTLRAGLGDIEVQVPKISFVREYGFVMTAYAALVFPTGSAGSGLHEGEWVVAPHLLTDLALGPIGLQMNGAVEVTTGGEVVAELRLSTAYTMVLGAANDVLLSPLVELETEIAVSRSEPVGIALVPGVKLAVGGWHVGFGIAVPLGREREADFEVMLQVGYHVIWNRLFAEGSAPSAD